MVADGRFQSMELEMGEPLLHLDAKPDAAERFTAQLAVRTAGVAVAC